MKTEDFRMITSVRLEYKSLKTKTGTVRDGPYWQGFWLENGKVKRVCMGRHLPKEIHDLLSSQFRPPWRPNFTWPLHRLQS